MPAELAGVGHRSRGPGHAEGVQDLVQVQIQQLGAGGHGAEGLGRAHAVDPAVALPGGLDGRRHPGADLITGYAGQQNGPAVRAQFLAQGHDRRNDAGAGMASLAGVVVVQGVDGGGVGIGGQGGRGLEVGAQDR